jgi:mycothiol synthase
MTEIAINDRIEIPEAPSVPGLWFRGFRGEADFPQMVHIRNTCWRVDINDGYETVEEVAASYKHLVNSNPETDMLFAEVYGEVVAYGRVSWYQEMATRERAYEHFGYVLPDWRRRGIGFAMLKQQQQRALEIAADHPVDGARFFEAWASNRVIGAQTMLERDGYTPRSHGAHMIRPDLENIPVVPLPDGVEVRPVTQGQMRQIWEADAEAFRDHEGYMEPTEEMYQQFLTFPYNDSELWRVAWQGDEVVGMVRSFINPAENEQYHRQRGYTEFISVRRPWRRMGVARALITRSLHALKERGMEEAALGVHVENPNGALKLYESCGFVVNRINTMYRKPLNEETNND